ncbi:MAG TPA: sterol desaturase family protein [Cyclobacteriaceae bacterium]|nr:sterol desaturase family protein [Cyclobacteriaceae bacterium]
MNINPIVLAIPVFFLLIGIELVVERLSHRNLYRLPDAIANMSCGITSQLSGLFMRVLGIGVYELLFANFAMFDVKLALPSWAYWLSLFLLTDLAYYWAHRMSHEVNLFWGGHVVHHQSEDYNLSVALRQSSFQVVWTFAFSLPIAIIGYQTYDFALVAALNTLYQFWIHTETINKLGWFEYIFNTPSHHRVHHGRNPKYIDKNHAGSLIIWDKMFGTFQAEEERPTYGITKPINSWNAVWANFSHYAVMSEEIQRIPKWTDKVKYLFKKPGWLPKEMGGYRPAPEVDKNTYRKYDTPAPVLLNYYVLVQYIICLGATAAFLFNQSKLEMSSKAVVAVLISWWVVNSGVLFEQKTWVKAAEYARIILFSAGLSVITVYYSLSPVLHAIALGYALLSIVWLSKLPSYEAKLAA